MSRPVTRRGAPQAETYVVCLDCGKHFAYDIKEMRLGKPIPTAPVTGVLRTTLPEDHHTGRRLAVIASAVSAVVALMRLFGGRKGSG